MSGPETQTLMRLPWSGDMPDDRYFALDSYDGTDATHWWDQTQLKRWAKSPLDWAAESTVLPSSALRFGTAAHALVLGSGAPVGKAVHTLRSKAGQEEAADAARRGVTLLPAADYEAVHAMAAVTHDVFSVMMPGRPEVTMLARERTDAGDAYLKGKADWLPDQPDDDGVRRIYDYKTTSQPLEDFGRTVFQGGYDIQAVFYLRLARLCGLDYQGFGWVVQSKTPPYPFRIYRVTGDDAQLTYAGELVDHVLADVAYSGRNGWLEHARKAMRDPKTVRDLCADNAWPLAIPQWAQDRRSWQAEEFEETHE